MSTPSPPKSFVEAPAASFNFAGLGAGQTSQQDPSRAPSPKRSTSPSRPQSNFRPTTRESITSSKVFRDLSPKKVWDKAPASESRTSLPGLFKIRNGLQSLRPNYSADVGEMQKHDENRQPKLLQSLEAYLDERLAVVEKIGSTSKGYASTKMKIDAHQQVLDALLHSFSTYRSLLTRIKSEYDRSIDDALRSIFDNVHMQAEIAAAQEQMEAAIRIAQQIAIEDAANARKEIHDEVEQQEAMALEAERRVELADEEIAAIKASCSALKQEEAELKRANAEAQQNLFLQSSFAPPPPPEPPAEKGKPKR